MLTSLPQILSELQVTKAKISQIEEQINLLIQTSSTTPNSFPNQSTLFKRELITLTGQINREFIQKWTQVGIEYYYASLKIPGEGNKTIFFFEPDPDLIGRLQDIPAGQEITVTGNFNKTGSMFTALELEINNGFESWTTPVWEEKTFEN